mmetsp:Transcript_42292/g.111859  ORF Transcript_42292/g.111859 Transcript_42292/m.111859 type:complete len:336 (-) Transcript_42292:284-1291(-)
MSHLGGLPRQWALVLLAAVIADAVQEPVLPYDPLYARAFAALTQASYCGPDERLLSWQCDACRDAGFHVVPGTVRFVEHREIVEANSTSAYVARITVPDAPSNDGCVIAFRGSQTLTNWIRDSQLWPRSVPYEWCDGCEVEYGFAEILKNVSPKLIRTLAEIGCVPEREASAASGKVSSLYLTGHSLGAAVSTLAMCFLGEAGFNIKLSYNFESPRVGNAAFASVFDKEFTRSIPVYRVTHRKDPVVHLPPRPIFGYTHVSVEVFYEGGDDFRVCPGTEDRGCGADRYSILETIPFVGDHCHSPLVGGDICTCILLHPTKNDVEATNPSAAMLVV